MIDTAEYPVAQAHRLSRLLTDREEQPWDESDLAAVLRHQLAAPVLLDLEPVDPRRVRHWRRESACGRLPIRTFADLLTHPDPPLELLELTKKFAKRQRHQSRSTLHPAVATVLYYAAILVAWQRRGHSISSLDEATIRGGMQWALERLWLDECLRSLFEEHASHVS